MVRSPRRGRRRRGCTDLVELDEDFLVDPRRDCGSRPGAGADAGCASTGNCFSDEDEASPVATTPRNQLQGDMLRMVMNIAPPDENPRCAPALGCLSGRATCMTRDRSTRGDQRHRAHGTPDGRRFPEAVAFSTTSPVPGQRPVFKIYTRDSIVVGGRTAMGMMCADEHHRGERFAQTRWGLTMICFVPWERADVDVLHTFLLDAGATIVHPPEDGAWAPEDHLVLFEDPDGVRLEMNYVPGKGLLKDLPPS